jgi:hypothetical protein
MSGVLYERKKDDSVEYILKEPNGQEKKIATLRGGQIEIHKMRSKHLMRKNNSYGYNKALVNHVPEDTTFKVKDEFGTYLVPVRIIKKRGKTMDLSLSHVEEQVFLSLSEMEVYRDE